MKESIHGERTVSELQDRVTELIEQQRAISEVLRTIANSPHDLQPIFDTILDSATHLCRADAGTLRLIEKEGYRLAAQKVRRYSPPTILEHGSQLGRWMASGTLIHIPDALALEPFREGESSVVVAAKGGVRTALYVPMLRNDAVIGALGIWRERVEPFTDKQIELVTDFAAQATIALVTTRRERQYRDMQSELAHANRVTTIGQFTASIVHETKQPIAAARNNAAAALLFLDKSPPEVSEVREALTCIVNDADRAGNILDRIRDHIKKAPSRKEVVDLNAAILEVTALTHSEAAKTGVTVDTQLAGVLPRIQCDRVQVQQVMLNLIVNAIQSMSGVEDGNRELHISTASIEPKGVCVAVRDTGHGLRPENLPRLFEPF